MPRELIEETEAEVRRLGDKLGIPPENIQTALDGCADDSETRALRRKWTKNAKTLDNTFATRLKQRQEADWSEQAQVLHGERLTEESRARRAQRERQALGARLDAALAGLSCMSTVGSSLRAADGGRSSERPAGPPPAERVDVTQEITAIRALVELIEDRWDAERGLLAPVDYQKMSGADKDILLMRLAGVHSRMINEAFPWMGSERTIQRRRHELAADVGIKIVPTTGLPREDVQAA